MYIITRTHISITNRCAAEIDFVFCRLFVFPLPNTTNGDRGKRVRKMNFRLYLYIKSSRVSSCLAGQQEYYFIPAVIIP